MNFPALPLALSAAKAWLPARRYWESREPRSALEVVLKLDAAVGVGNPDLANATYRSLTECPAGIPWFDDVRERALIFLESYDEAGAGSAADPWERGIEYVRLRNYEAALACLRDAGRPDVASQVMLLEVEYRIGDFAEAAARAAEIARRIGAELAEPDPLVKKFRRLVGRIEVRTSNPPEQPDNRYWINFHPLVKWLGSRNERYCDDYLSIVEAGHLLDRLAGSNQFTAQILKSDFMLEPIPCRTVLSWLDRKSPGLLADVLPDMNMPGARARKAAMAEALIANDRIDVLAHLFNRQP